MLTGRSRYLTLTEYRTEDAPAHLRQVLRQDVLVSVPPASDRTTALTLGLAKRLKQVVDGKLIRTHAITLQVPVSSQISQENRCPDLVVLTPKLAAQLREKRGAITLEMSNPALVVEVVGPYGTPADETYYCDYIQKRQQYEQRGVPEYWIVDPTAAEVTVLALHMQDRYQGRAFRGPQRIRSAGFPTLDLTADDLLGLGAE
ncbi:MAG: Uma2 family endonuclease [Nodosilinea sp.]